MQQVFDVLPTLPDDYAAYVAHMKAEAEKRQAEKLQQHQQHQQQAQGNSKILRANNNINAAKKKETERKPANNTANSNSHSSSTNETAAGSNHSATTTVNPTNATVRGEINRTNTEPVEQHHMQHANVIIDEECTIERIYDIKRILCELYTIYSPDKISKIDRLLHKYLGYEEDFLRFVYAKYNVSPEKYEPEKYALKVAAAVSAPIAGEKEQEQEQQEEEEQEVISEGNHTQKDMNSDAQSLQDGEPSHPGRSEDVSG